MAENKEREFMLRDTVDALSDIQETLEKAHFVQQLVNEKFFGRRNTKEHDVKLGIILEYHRYGVFSSILSDNIIEAEALVRDLLSTVQKTLQDS